MNSITKTIIFWLVIAAAATLGWFSLKRNQTTQAAPEISYSQFLSQVDSGAVSRVRISGNVIEGSYRDGSAFRTNTPPNQSAMVEELRSKDVEIWYDRNDGNSTTSWLMNLAPLVLLAFLWFFMIRTIRVRRNQQPTSPTGTINGSVSGS